MMLRVIIYQSETRILAWNQRNMKMKALEGIEPKKVFGFFEEITQIPHGSYNLEGIRKYLTDFAEKRNLEYIADDAGNVIIKKPATNGYENEPGVILQGHMDMVAVCEEGSGIDMKTHPLDIFIDGDLIGAKKTSLGGDDGIAVAMALAILDSKDIPHPALEVVITANEETGMEGASGLDISNISFRRLINIDSEDEGIFTVGCAGGARVYCNLESYDTPYALNKTYELKIKGLIGGHSGQMINKGRMNACKAMGRILAKACDPEGYSTLNSILGGSADNVIPSECTANVTIPLFYATEFEKKVIKEAELLKKEFSETDPDFEFTIHETDADEEDNDISISLQKVANLIDAFPNGVIKMSEDVEGLVQTSLNLGIVKCDNGAVTCEFSVRSSIAEEKEQLIDRLTDITEENNGTYSISGDYPGWKYAVESPLRDKMVKVFRDMYAKEPKVEAIHAGLECGFFIDKAPDMDAVSFGPDMQDIHSPSERLSISSTARTYEYLLKVLATKD